MLAAVEASLGLHIVGVIGSVLLILGYLKSGKPPQVPGYVHWLNLLGASCVMALCLATHAWAAAGLEAAWAAIALTRIVR
jgi:hypothetical protein